MKYNSKLFKHYRLFSVIIAMFLMVTVCPLVARAETIPSGAYNVNTYKGRSYKVMNYYDLGADRIDDTKTSALISNHMYFANDILTISDHHVDDNYKPYEGSHGAYYSDFVIADFSASGAYGKAGIQNLIDQGIIEVEYDNLDIKDLEALAGSKLDLANYRSIRKITFKDPRYVVWFYSRRIPLGYEKNADTKPALNGMCHDISSFALYASSVDLNYEYDGSADDYLWQDGNQSALPKKIYAANGEKSKYKLTMPLPAKKGSSITTFCDMGSLIDFMNNPGEVVNGSCVVEGKGASNFSEDACSKLNGSKIQVKKSPATMTFGYTDGVTFTFHANGGTIKGCAKGKDYYISQQEIKNYTTAQVNKMIDTPTRSGYTLVGWGYKKGELIYENEKEIASGWCQAPTYIIERGGVNIDLYAVWKKNKQTNKIPAKNTLLKDSKGKSTGYRVTSNNPKNLTVIYEGTKADANKTTITVPDTFKDTKGNVYKVTAVKQKTFYKNQKVKTIKFGNNVKTIGKQAAANCPNLKKVIIGKAVNKIEAKALYGNGKLNTVTINSKVKLTVGTKAFTNMGKGSEIKVAGGTKAIKNANKKTISKYITKSRTTVK